ncbi:MAG: class I SAM-dependent methyltransferase [Actinomycetota bacterium]
MPEGLEIEMVRGEHVVINTATGAALTREAHRMLDAHPRIFDDPFAARLLDPGVEEVIQLMESMGTPEATAAVRCMVVGRSRYVEDRLARAVQRGVRQYVILGAGLDSFAYRNDFGVKVFELDLPQLLKWKREKTARAKLDHPAELNYVPIDFESESVMDALRRSHYDVNDPGFLSWVGVTPYLSPEAIESTLRSLASLAIGSEVVLSYCVPSGMWSSLDRALADFAIPAAESRGEPVRTFFTPKRIQEILASLGFKQVQHFGPEEAADLPEFQKREDLIRPQGFERYVASFT